MCVCNSSPGDQEFKASMSCVVKLYLDVGEGCQACIVSLSTEQQRLPEM